MPLLEREDMRLVEAEQDPPVTLGLEVDAMPCPLCGTDTPREELRHVVVQSPDGALELELLVCSDCLTVLQAQT